MSDLRSSTARRAAENDCLEAVRERASSLSCRIVGLVRWSPLMGLSGEVKVFRVLGDKIDPEGSEVTDQCMKDVMAFAEQYNCVLMPVLTALGADASTEIACVAIEDVERIRAKRNGAVPSTQKAENEV